MMETLNLIHDVWEQNDPWQWVAAGTTALTVVLIAVGLRRWVRRRHRALAETERLELMELPLQVASETSSIVLIAGAVFVALSTLSLPTELRHGMTSVFVVFGFWQLGLWGSAAVLAWLMARRRTAADVDRASLGSLGIISFVLRVLVWVLILLLALENLGVDVTALVAGLGVGGIAIALALQNILGDLFASLSITLDRPFVVGDFIVVGDYMGSVEQIGVKSTRLRSLGGEQIVTSNADLLASRVRNYGRMTERRVVFTLGATYETPRAKLKQIPMTIRKIVEQQAGTRFDRSHFSKFGDFALEFETVYYVLSADYTRYMALQEAILLDIHEAFECAQIEFAYPTQKLWVAAASPADNHPATLLGASDGRAAAAGQ